MYMPFDPLQFLESEIRLDFSLDSSDNIAAKGMWFLLPHQKGAKVISKNFDTLPSLHLAK